MFSFSANIFNRFVYFRAQKTVVPVNLEAGYAILGSGLDLKTSQTDYKNPSQYKQTGLDKLFGIGIKDQRPPLKFMEMGFTDIYIKSAFPLIAINFSVYLFVLLVISINKQLNESELHRLANISKNISEEDKKKGNYEVHPSACKKAIMITFQSIETHFRWSSMIRMNLLIY